MRSKMTSRENEAKFAEMQKYKPFLEKVITKLCTKTKRDGSDHASLTQLRKIETLRNFLTNKSTNIKLESLLKYEKVLQRLQSKAQKINFLESDQELLSDELLNLDIYDLMGPESPSSPDCNGEENNQPVVIPTERRRSPIIFRDEDFNRNATIKYSSSDSSSHHRNHNKQHHRHHHRHDSKSHNDKGRDHEHERLENKLLKPDHLQVNLSARHIKSPFPEMKYEQRMNKKHDLIPGSSPKQEFSKLSKTLDHNPQSDKYKGNGDEPHPKQDHQQNSLTSKYVWKNPNVQKSLPDANKHLSDNPSKITTDFKAPPLNSKCIAPIPEILKSPPLSAKDINDLMFETSEYGTECFNEIGTRRSVSSNVPKSNSPNVFDPPFYTSSSLDFVRKKFAMIANINANKSTASPLSPSVASSLSPLPVERLALKYNPHRRSNTGSSLSSDNGYNGDQYTKSNLNKNGCPIAATKNVPVCDRTLQNVNVLPTINPKDPRLNRGGRLLSGNSNPNINRVTGYNNIMKQASSTARELFKHSSQTFDKSVIPKNYNNGEVIASTAVVPSPTNLKKLTDCKAEKQQTQGSTERFTIMKCPKNKISFVDNSDKNRNSGTEIVKATPIPTSNPIRVTTSPANATITTSAATTTIAKTIATLTASSHSSATDIIPKSDIMQRSHSGASKNIGTKDSHQSAQARDCKDLQIYSKATNTSNNRLNEALNDFRERVKHIDSTKPKSDDSTVNKQNTHEDKIPTSKPESKNKTQTLSSENKKINPINSRSSHTDSSVQGNKHIGNKMKSNIQNSASSKKEVNKSFRIRPPMSMPPCVETTLDKMYRTHNYTSTEFAIAKFKIPKKKPETFAKEGSVVPFTSKSKNESSTESMHISKTESLKSESVKSDKFSEKTASIKTNGSQGKNDTESKTTPNPKKRGDGNITKDKLEKVEISKSSDKIEKNENCEADKEVNVTCDPRIQGKQVLADQNGTKKLVKKSQDKQVVGYDIADADANKSVSTKTTKTLTSYPAQKTREKEVESKTSEETKSTEPLTNCAVKSHKDNNLDSDVTVNDTNDTVPIKASEISTICEIKKSPEKKIVELEITVTDKHASKDCMQNKTVEALTDSEATKSEEHQFTDQDAILHNPLSKDSVESKPTETLRNSESKKSPKKKLVPNDVNPTEKCLSKDSGQSEITEALTKCVFKKPLEKAFVGKKSIVEPGRITRRRCSMMVRGSAPEVDKEKLLRANALLFEDIDLEKAQNKQQQQELHCSPHSLLAGNLQKTIDKTSISTENIIVGKRRTRAILNFNESEIAKAVFSGGLRTSEMKKEHKAETLSNDGKEILKENHEYTEKSKSKKNASQVKQKDNLELKSNDEFENCVKPNTKYNKKASEDMNKSARTIASVTTADRSVQFTNTEILEDNLITLSEKSKICPNKENINNDSIKGNNQGVESSKSESEVTSMHSSNCASTSAEINDNGRSFLNEFVQEIFKPNSDKQPILDVLNEILDKEKFNFVKTVIETATKKTQQNHIKGNADYVAEDNNSGNQYNHNKEIEKTEDIKTVFKNEKLPDHDGDTSSAVIASREEVDNVQKKPSKPRRCELDRLNDDIRDMFICEGVLTATGKRMCTLIAKEKDKKDSKVLETAPKKANTSLEGKIKGADKKKTNKMNKTTTQPPADKQLSSAGQQNDSAVKTEDNGDIIPNVIDNADFNLDDKNNTQNNDSPNITEMVMKVKQDNNQEMSQNASIGNSVIAKRRKLKIKLAKVKFNKGKFSPAERCDTPPVYSKPCPKSKKQTVNGNLSPGTLLRDMELSDTFVDASVRNTNTNWHSQSKYIKWCVVCQKKIPPAHFIKHYKLQHGENYVSRLAPSILQKLKQRKFNKPLFGINKPSRHIEWFYRCPFCLQYFAKSLSNWLRHLCDHTSEYQYECTKCSGGNNSYATMRMHVDSGKCENAEIVQNDFKVMQNKQLKVHVCHLCNFMQFKRRSLETHYLNQHYLKLENIELMGYSLMLLDLNDVEKVDEMEANIRRNRIRQQLEREQRVIDIEDEDNSSKITTISLKNKDTSDKIDQDLRTESLKHSTEPFTEEKASTDEKEGDCNAENSISASNQEEICATNKRKLESMDIGSEPKIRKLNTGVPVLDNVHQSNIFVATRDSNNSSPIIDTVNLAQGLMNVEEQSKESMMMEKTNTTISMAERLAQRFKSMKDNSSGVPTADNVQQSFQNDNTQHEANVADDVNINNVINITSQETRIDENNQNTDVETANDNCASKPANNEDDEGWEDIEVIETAPNSNATYSLISTISNTVGKVKSMGLLQKFMFKVTKNKKSLSPGTTKKKPKEKITKSGTVSPIEKTVATNTCGSPNQNTKFAETCGDHTYNLNRYNNLGFKPIITTIEDLLPDSPCNDPIELVPELAPLEPLQDLNDISSILEVNLEVAGSIENSVNLNSTDNQTSIEDALDFINEQQAEEAKIQLQQQQQQQQQQEHDQHQIKVQLVNTNTLNTHSLNAGNNTKIMQNRVQHVGYSEVLVNESSEGRFKFYCLLDNCQFLYSNDAISLEDHFSVEHQGIKWNGYCQMCHNQVMNKEETDEGYEISGEVKHMLDKHVCKPPSTEPLAANNVMVENEEKPRIKLRRLTGDCLSVNNSIESTSESSSTNANTILINLLNAENKAMVPSSQYSLAKAPNAIGYAHSMSLLNGCITNNPQSVSSNSELYQMSDTLQKVTPMASCDSIIPSSSMTQQPISLPIIASIPLSTSMSLNINNSQFPQITNISSLNRNATTAWNISLPSSVVSSTLSSGQTSNSINTPAFVTPLMMDSRMPFSGVSFPNANSLGVLQRQAVATTISVISTPATTMLSSASSTQPSITPTINNRIFRCMGIGCKYFTRIAVAMKDHLNYHQRCALGDKRDFFNCSLCDHKAETIQDYMQHASQAHNLNNSTNGSSNATCVKSMDSTGGVCTPTALQQNINDNYSSKLAEAIEEIVGFTGLNEDKLYRCVIKDCQEVLHENNFIQHITQHVGLKSNQRKDGKIYYKCPHCTIHYQKPVGLKAHIKVHAICRFFCYLCEKTTANTGQMLKHFCETHWNTINICRTLLSKTSYKYGIEIELPLDCAYYVVYTHVLNEMEVKEFGKKLIMNWQIRKAATKTHFKSTDIDVLPMQPIFPRIIHCGECEYGTKVRTNLYRHLLKHKQQNEGCNSQADAPQALMASVDPVNPVPCLNSNERFFDKMTNLASSSLVTASKQLPAGIVGPNTTSPAYGAVDVQSSATTPPIPIATTTTTTAAATASTIPTPTTTTNNYNYDIGFCFVGQGKRFTCGVLDCKYLSLSEDIFRIHLTTLHTDSYIFCCPHCGESISKRGASVDRIISHLKFHGDTLYRCTACNYMHFLKCLLKRHINDKHPNESIIVVQHDRLQPGETNGICSAILLGSCEQTAKSARRSKASNISNLSNNTNKFKWRCTICQYKAVGLTQIQKHCSSTHNRVHLYQCIHCEFGSEQLANILRHVDAKHNGKAREAHCLYLPLSGGGNDETADAVDTTPLWQRDDPNRVRHIRGILMEDEEESERHRLALLNSTDENINDEMMVNAQTNAVNSNDCNHSPKHSKHSNQMLQIPSNNFDQLLKSYEFACFHCEYKTRDLYLLKHIHWHQKHTLIAKQAKPFLFSLIKLFGCAECHNFIGTHNELQDHLVTVHEKCIYYAADVHNNHPEHMKCGYCNFTSKNVSTLIQHFQHKEHQPKDIELQSQLHLDQLLQLNPDRETCYECNQCHKIFGNQLTVKDHGCPNNSKSDKLAFRMHVDTCLNQCPVCAYTSVCESDTYRHMIEHYYQFKICHFCKEVQTSFNTYMQHCYSEHREGIRKFRSIFPYNNIKNYLLQMYIIFPSGLLLTKCSLLKTKFGLLDIIRSTYEELCKTSQRPPIPRLSLGRLVAKMGQGGGNTLTAKKISRRRSTIADIDNNLQSTAAFTQSLNTVPARSSVQTPAAVTFLQPQPLALPQKITCRRLSTIATRDDNQIKSNNSVFSVQWKQIVPKPTEFSIQATSKRTVASSTKVLPTKSSSHYLALLPDKIDDKSSLLPLIDNAHASGSLSRNAVANSSVLTAARPAEHLTNTGKRTFEEAFGNQSLVEDVDPGTVSMGYLPNSAFEKNLKISNVVSLYKEPCDDAVKPYSFYGLPKKPIDLSKIYTKVAVAGVDTLLAVDKFKLLINMEPSLVLKKCCSDYRSYANYKHIKRTCPASQKHRFI